MAFDIEANGLLDTVTDIHSLVLEDLDTGTILSCTNNGYGYAPISEGLDVLVNADIRIAHNGVGYDDPCLLKLYPLLPLKRDGILDTLLISQMVYPDLFVQDMRTKKLPPKMWGSHSLKAWGLRLGEYKGEYSETTDWSTWDEDMQKYCEQDVTVLKKLYYHLQKKSYMVTPDAVRLEHRFAQITHQMEMNGAPFDMEKATALAATIEQDCNELTNKIREIVPPNKKTRILVPKRDNKTKGYKAGQAVEIVTTEPFNPNSRQQVIRFLKDKYDWEPDTVTDKGNPELDGEILEGLEFPEAKMFAELFDRNKILGQLAKGQKAWLKFAKEGTDGLYAIHGRLNTLGTRTHRCSHTSPNLGQVPSPRAIYGRECRELFRAPKGFKFVGCDASGIELRNLAHYLYPYDGGDYVRTILSSDIHTKNQTDAGLPTRDNAKTFIYAFNYGAGDAKLGAIVAPTASLEKRKQIGATLRRSFLAKNVAMSRVIDACKLEHNRSGMIVGLDGRKLLSVSAHSALNTKLQSCGAVLMKRATVILWDWIEEQNLQNDVKLVLHVHDEYQHLVRDVDDLPARVGELAKQAIIAAGEYYKFNCPLDGEYKIGDNWYDCH